MQEAHHRALPAAEIQAVVPVGAQALADAVLPDLPRGEIEDARQMLIDRALAAVGVGDALVRKAELPGLADILHHGGDQPQRVVRTGVLQVVDDLAFIGRRDHCGRAEGLLLSLRLEPARLEQVQAVAGGGQGAQQLDQAAAALFRV